MIDCNKTVFYCACFEGPNFRFMDFELRKYEENGFSYSIGKVNFLSKNKKEIIGLKREVEHLKQKKLKYLN